MAEQIIKLWITSKFKFTYINWPQSQATIFTFTYMNWPQSPFSRIINIILKVFSLIYSNYTNIELGFAILETLQIAMFLVWMNLNEKQMSIGILRYSLFYAIDPKLGFLYCTMKLNNASR